LRLAVAPSTSRARCPACGGVACRAAYIDPGRLQQPRPRAPPARRPASTKVVTAPTAVRVHLNQAIQRQPPLTLPPCPRGALREDARGVCVEMYHQAKKNTFVDGNPRRRAWPSAVWKPSRRPSIRWRPTVRRDRLQRKRHLPKDFVPFRRPPRR